jgi:glycerol kinase
MAQLDELGKNELARGVAIGVAAAVLIPAAAIMLAPYWRPAARSALKLGIRALEKAREAGAELAELVEDVTAEVQDELRTARAPSVDPVAPTRADGTEGARPPGAS